MDALDHLSVRRLAMHKGLDPAFLRRAFGLTDRQWFGDPAVSIPYYDVAGAVVYRKVRLSDGSARRVPSGGAVTLYGLERLSQLAPDAMILLVEGESDVWAALTHDVAALGIPGASSWRSDWTPLLAERPVVLWEEPDAAGAALVVRLARDLPDAMVIVGTAAVPDLCALHQCPGADFTAAFDARLAGAVPIRARARWHVQRKPSAHTHRLIGRRTPPPVGRDDTFERQLASARGRDISSLLTSMGFTLTGTGTNRSMCCPFHEDTRASLSVNVQLGVWKCHGCGAHGDAIAFVMQHRRLAFKDAVREVAS